MKEETIDCNICGGFGYIIDIEIDVACCGCWDEYGNCCNIPTTTQKQVQKICPHCYQGQVLI